MTKRKDEIGARLDKLALQLINDVERTNDEARDGDTEDTPPAVTAALRLEVFKAVGSYYLGVLKVRAKLPDLQIGDDEPQANFSDIRERIHAINGGKT